MDFDLDENLSEVAKAISDDRTSKAIVDGRVSTLDEGAGAGVLALRGLSTAAGADVTHTTPVSFHGPGPAQIDKNLSGVFRCKDSSFFRILDGRMSKHTVQGERVVHDFLVQMYVAFAEEGVTETISITPAGLPLSWDAGELNFQALVSGLTVWKLSAAEYRSFELPFLSCTQYEAFTIVTIIPAVCINSLKRCLFLTSLYLIVFYLMI